ncbi:MAG: sialate O-acetylesterase [Bacteroidota bacterium]
MCNFTEAINFMFKTSMTATGKFLSCCLANLLFIYCAPAQSKPDPKFELYILMGQSNMAGRGLATDELKMEGNDSLFSLNKEKKWVVARHPLHFDKPAIAGVGPGLAFGIEMVKAKPGVRIGLIPCAVGGTPIEHWLPGAYDSATKTHPYDDAVERILFAMQRGVIKGVIWHQGEANSEPEAAKKYPAELAELIARVRVLVGDPQLPFVAGELGRFLKTSENINAQLALLPGQIPQTAVASSEGLIDKGDQLHFDSPSATELGKRYAAKMIALQK